MNDPGPGRPPRSKSIARALTAAVTLVLVGSAGTSSAGAQPGESRLDAIEQGVISELNRERGRRGLRRFTPSRALARSADSHSADMLRGDFFAHASSNGTSFPGRVRRYTRAARIGENLALVSGQGGGRVARQVVRMWMNSPSHRAAVLGGYDRIGVARRTGRMGARQVTVFTADLSSRR